MGKHILILSNQKEILKDNCTIRGVFCTANVSEALTVVMGGSASFGAHGYSNTGKVRPELVLMDESFLSNHDGIEFLDILRKYYTLNKVKVFVIAARADSIDQTIYKKYRISGFVPKNVDLRTVAQRLSENASHTGPVAGSTFMLPALFFSWRHTFASAANHITALKVACCAAAITVTTLAANLAPEDTIGDQSGEKVGVPVAARRPNIVSTETAPVKTKAKKVSETSTKSVAQPDHGISVSDSGQTADTAHTADRPDRTFHIIAIAED